MNPFDKLLELIGNMTDDEIRAEVEAYEKCCECEDCRTATTEGD